MFENQKFFENFSPLPEEALEIDSLGSMQERESEQAVLKDGIWSQEEVFKFISFLIYNRQALKLKLQRRTSKVFKQMAHFIATRTSVQCRSQNQRLFRKYKSMKNIVASFKAEYGCDRFEQDYTRIAADPVIKFKTQYQNYIQQHVKKAADVATQTDMPTFFPPETFYWPMGTPVPMQECVPFGGNFSNWIIIPFCS